MTHLPFRRSRAVVVGINAYSNGLTPLRTAVADARAVARALEKDHDFDVLSRLDDEATRAALLDLFERELPTEITDEDRLVVYFAGHGIAFDEHGDGPRGFLLAQDARSDDDSGRLSMDRLRAALGRLPCRHLLVILDCCFAGSFRWASTRAFVPTGAPLYSSQLQRFLDGKAWQVLTSAAHDQIALDTLPGLRNPRDGAAVPHHSPFAAALLNGLAGAADSSRGSRAPDGVITATELHQWIAEELARGTGGLGGPGGDHGLRQTPGLWPLHPESTGEFVFFSPGRPIRTRPDPPLDEAHNPWLGLTAYGSSDAERFFGRRRVVDALVRHLEDAHTPLVAVVGASGTGKSSVVRAGLLPRLEADRSDWRVVRCERLEDDPASQLRRALDALTAPGPAASIRGLLVLDQVEELFTQCHDPHRREDFLDTLGRALDDPSPASQNTTVLVVTSSDFEPRLAAAPQLTAAWARGRYVLPPFSADELRDVIERPAQHMALWLEPPDLAGELLDEVLAMPGALPLVSFVLAETYRQALVRRRRDGALDRALTAADYRAVGGVVGALHRRAEALYGDADPALRRTIRRVFLRLISLDGGRAGRRRVELGEFDAADPAERTRVGEVLERFIRARLLVADEGHVEPAHDTLVVAWPRLNAWRADDAETLPLLRAAWHAARAWQDADEDPRLLWDRDPRLGQLAASVDDLNALELAFLRRSTARRKRSRRLAIAGSAAVGAALGGLALHAARKARLAESRLRGALAVADEIVSTLDRDLSRVVGTAPVRRRLLDASARLLDRLLGDAHSDLPTLSSRLAGHLRRGDLARSHDDLELVESEYLAAARVAQRLLALEPDNPHWRHALANAEGRLGDVAKTRGELDEARRLYDSSHARLEALCAADPETRNPESDELHRDLAIVLNQFGALAELEADLDAAERFYEQSLELKRRLIDESVAAPGDGRRRNPFDLVVSYDKLGNVAALRGDLDAARAWYEEGLRIKRSFAEAEPRSALWQRGLAFSHERLGSVAEARGEFDLAARLYGECREILARLLRDDPSNSHLQRDHVRSRERLEALGRGAPD